MTIAKLAAILLLSAAHATAQVTPINGSGCPTMPGISVLGNGKINTGLKCACPLSIDRMRVMIGLPGSWTVFNKPFMCADRCSMPMTPLFLLSTSGWSVQIPNDKTLVGQRLVVQCLQTSINKTCVILTGASEIKIQL